MLIIGYLWALPNTIIGLLLSLLYLPKHIRWSEGCIELSDCQRLFGGIAQTHGFVIYYKTDSYRANKGIRVHERVHVKQAFLMGILFLIAYIGQFTWLYIKAKRKHQSDPWGWAYMRIWAEEDARTVENEFRSGGLSQAWGSKDAS